MKIYDSCSIAIRTAFIGFVMIAFGFLVQNESVNIFYTFKNSFILFVAEGSLKVGNAIIINLPMIFMLNIVCKKANSAYPVCLALVGYFSYMVVTMLFSTNALANTAYATSSGINSILNINTGTKYPLETGLIGSFIVGYITRVSYIRSRHRTSYSLLGFLNRDTAGIIYNIVFCSLVGLGVSYIWPIIFKYIQTAITYVSKDLSDPLRMAVYGMLDRALSILGLNRIIRQPFWNTALGGSLQTTAGQTIVGDVNIWNYIKNSNATYAGAGRFITAYYVINMFIVPALYLGIVLTVTDKEEKRKLALPLIGAIALSVICGNPLPIELVLTFTSPLLLIFYFFIVGISYYFLTLNKIYLGSSITTGDIASAMPGSFPDFIINLRNANYHDSMMFILLVGLIAFALMFIITWLYYRYFAYDVINTGKSRTLAKKIISAVGGEDNISNVTTGLFKVSIHLKDLEKVEIDKIQRINTNTVSETKDGIDIECGSSSYIIANKIRYYKSLTKKQ